jgi:5-methyltetrahydrofolate--homocysteine methyltransferase
VIPSIGRGGTDPAASAWAGAASEASARGPILAAIERFSLVLDAGIGTRLLERGLELPGDDPALWCLSHPDLVEAIHRRDVASGSDAILTNTFGANRSWLARFGQVSEVGAINRAAVALARSAAGEDRFVIGSIGPTTAAEPGAAAEQGTILVKEGVDALLLETFRYPEVGPVLAEVTAAVRGAVPVFVSLCEWPEEPRRAAGRLVDRGAAVLGLNCGPGAAQAVALAGRLGREAGVPLLVKPGSGPRAEAVMSPEELAAVVPVLLDQNVRLIGGCCGTDERHIAAVAACVRIHRVSLRYRTGDRGR